ncbi:MAG: transposase domain-containing protein [Pseudomonadota bacterium]
MASLNGSAKLNSANPEANLEHALNRMLNQHKQSDIIDLMSWNSQA